MAVPQPDAWAKALDALVALAKARAACSKPDGSPSIPHEWRLAQNREPRSRDGNVLRSSKGARSHLLRRVAIKNRSANGKQPGRHQIVISRRNSMHQHLVANQTAIDEQKDRVAIELLYMRAGDQPSMENMAVSGAGKGISNTRGGSSTRSCIISDEDLECPFAQLDTGVTLSNSPLRDTAQSVVAWPKLSA